MLHAALLRLKINYFVRVGTSPDFRTTVDRTGLALELVGLREFSKMEISSASKSKRR
jgi:hypothetical protein